jgi:hypothetical protein
MRLTFEIIMQYLHDVHKMNAFWADRVCLSVRMFELENRWTDFDGIWYGRYATGGYHKLVLFNSLQSELF